VKDDAGAWLFWIPALVTAAVIATLSHQPSLGLGESFPDKPAHVLEYAFFTLTLIFALTRGFDRRRNTVGRIVVAVLLASMYGASDEWHQSFVGRDATIEDWFADIAGAAIAATGVLVWRRARWRMAGARQRV
jgi:VanZ family protein